MKPTNEIGAGEDVIHSVRRQVGMVGSMLDAQFPKSPPISTLDNKLYCLPAKSLMLYEYLIDVFPPVLEITCAQARSESASNTLSLLIGEEFGFDMENVSKKSPPHSTLFREITQELRIRTEPHQRICGLAQVKIHDAIGSLLEHISNDARCGLVAIYTFYELYRTNLRSMLASCCASLDIGTDSNLEYFETHDNVLERIEQVIAALKSELSVTTGSRKSFGILEATHTVDLVSDLICTAFTVERSMAAHA